MKKTILATLAAAALLSAVALVGCNNNKHTHSYSWKSDSEQHWQECECGDKKDPVGHVDEKNNDTDEAGADEKCDVCGRGYFAVTFNMDGHGTAPETQYVGEDGKVEEPETPADDDSYKFKGWYKDAQHTTPFDFDADTVTEATQIFAWFEDDDTAGASKKYAYALVLDEGNPQKAKKNEVVYYSFKATEDGRYTISLGAGTNNENATFTTSVTDETTYGKGCASSEVTVDIDKNQTVYVLFTFLGEEGDDVVVSPIVTNVDDETLPAGIFEDGEYGNGSISLEFTNEGKKVNYDGAEYIAKYIGGKYKTLTFIKAVSLVGGATFNETFALTANENGTYTLRITSSGSSSSYSVSYIEPQNPVALSNIVGYYEPKTDAYNGITELYIYSSESAGGTSVLYREEGYNQSAWFDRYSDLKAAVYDTEKNRLTVGAVFSATLKLGENDAVESLLIGGVEYVKIVEKGEVGAIPPEKLPLINTDTEYTGDTHKIRIEYGSQYFGDGTNSITIIKYVQTTGLYTVSVNVDNTFTTYYLKVSADNKTVTLYQQDGETVVDTLSVFEWVYHDLPTTEQEVSVAVSDFQKSYYIYQAKAAGWYNITVPNGVKVYYPLNTYDLTDRYSPRTASGTVYLAQDALVGIYMETPAAITVTVTTVASPEGLSENNPKELVNGAATLDIVPAADPENPVYQNSYFTFTAPVAGTYIVKAVYNGMMGCETITINNDEQYASWDEYYTEIIGVSVTLDADEEILIALLSDEGWEYVTVTVREDITADATDLTLEGTAENDVLTVSATATTGVNYYIASTKEEDVTVTGNAAFSILTQTGAVIEAEENEGVYTAVIYAGNDVYFKIQSATQQTLTLTQIFEKGSMGYPVEITLEDGTKEIEVVAGESTYFTLAEGVYSFNSSDYWLYVSLNGEEVYNDTPVAVKADDVLMYSYMSRQGTATLTISEVVYLFTEAEAGTYNGESSVDAFGDGSELIDYALTLTFDRFGIGTYTLVEGENEPEVYENIAITKNDEGKYTFTYGEGMDTHTVVFSFVEGALQVSDGFVSDADSFTMNKEAEVVTITYEGKAENAGGTTQWDIIVEITGDKVVCTVDGEILSRGETTKNGNTYTVGDGEGDTFTVIVSEDGKTVSFAYSYYVCTGTLNKQSSAEVGTEENPEVVEFTEDSATVEVPLSDPEGDNAIEYYLQLPEGMYSIVDGFNGMDYTLKIFADGDVVETLTVNPMDSTYYIMLLEGDLLVVVNYSNSEDITITKLDD